MHAPRDHREYLLQGAIPSTPTVAKPALPHYEERLSKILAVVGLGRDDVHTGHQHRLRTTCPDGCRIRHSVTMNADHADLG